MSNIRGLRSWAPALVVALLAALTPGPAGAMALQAALGGTSIGTQAYSPLGVTAAHQVTKDDPVPTRTYSEPSLLVDPDNPKVIVASAVEMRTKICYLMRSTDAGATWSVLPALPGTNAFPDCFTVNGGQTQSPMAWGRNHTLYYGLLGYDQADGGNGRSGNISVLLARSTDLGTSWSTSIVDNSRGKTGDQVQNDSPVASVAVDSHSAAQDIVYVGWNQSFPNSKSPDSPTLVATSTDGGQTFAPGVNVNKFYSEMYTDSDGTKYHIALGTPFLAVGPTGTLYAVAAAGVPFSVMTFPPLPLLSAVSTDHGHTWTVQKFDDASKDLSEPMFRSSPMGGPQGTLLVVYQDKLGTTQTQGSEDIYFQRSTDGAKTWSSPVRLNDDDPTAQTYHFMPNMSVAPNGRIDVAWYDFRNANRFENDVYYTYSTDNGVSWAKNVRASDQSISRAIGPNANFDIRIPPGVASTNDFAVVGWSDTRLGDSATQTQDVFADVVQFKAITSSTNRTLRYLAAAAAGLAVAGAIVLVIALGRRRRDVEPPSPPPAPKAREPQPVGVQ
jgi:hypothetical protein